MASSPWHLRQKKERLAREIAANLDFLAGSVTSQGPRGGWSLTFKVDGKTRTKYIRTSVVDDVRRMVARHAKLKALLAELAEVNWDLLKAESEPGKPGGR